MGSFIDRSGFRYGRLLVLHRDDTIGPASKGRRVRWVCQCDCGQKVAVTGHGLSRGDVKSCGCLRKENTKSLGETHGMTKSREYSSWAAMKERCGLTGTKGVKPSYEGIKVCDSWVNSFENFLADMGPRPEGTTLDRIDVRGDYTRQNCRWATDHEQRNNKKTSITWKGRTMSLKEVALMEGLNPISFRKRLREYGDSPQEAIDRLRATGKSKES